MPAFEYAALDASGKRRKGVQQGESPRHVRQLLRDSGLTPLTVEAVSRAQSPGAARLRRRSLNANELALLTRQLATLVRAGLPLDDALQALSEQVGELNTRRLVLAIRGKVMEGHSLSEGMGQFPEVFPDLYLATVSAGEHSRDLAQVLERLADYSEQHHALVQRVQLAMLYPAILSLTALLVTAGLLGFVVPEVVAVFAQTDQPLPGITVALIGLSDALRDGWHLALTAVLLALLGLRQLLKSATWRLRLHHWLLKLPLVGGLIRENNAARFCRTLGILLDSGVPLLESLRIACRALTNQVMLNSVSAATIRVQEGESLSQALRQDPQLPPLSLHLIANGEAAGTLETMLLSAANAHERNLQTRINTLLGLLEPALILTMGAVVLVIVIAILLPIFELNQLV